MTMIKYSVNPEERPKVSFKLLLKTINKCAISCTPEFVDLQFY